jgi:hypothetical protein
VEDRVVAEAMAPRTACDDRLIHLRKLPCDTSKRKLTCGRAAGQVLDVPISLRRGARRSGNASSANSGCRREEAVVWPETRPSRLGADSCVLGRVGPRSRRRLLAILPWLFFGTSVLVAVVARSHHEEPPCGRRALPPAIRPAAPAGRSPAPTAGREDAFQGEAGGALPRRPTTVSSPSKLCLRRRGV